MNLTADGRAVMENKYRYDAVDNILGIANAVDPTQANSNNNNSNNNNSNNNNSNNNKAKLGGAFNHTYAYDDLNRLIRANGEAKGAKYEMTMTFGRMSEPLTKVQKVESSKTAQSYDFTYKYEDSNHPTAPTQIGHEHYTYDANGNPTLVENDSLNTERRMYWDEDNRLMVLSDNGKTSRYTYNAAGERIGKSHGDLEGVYVNGAPQGLTFHETEDYTIYPAPIITVTKNRFTKHYFIGDKRVASKLGVGKFSNVYGVSSNNVTAGQKDYAARMLQIEKQREEYYRKLGTPPGVPTMKGATADPDNTGRGYNEIIGDLGDHSVPEGWVQRPKFNDKELDEETGLYYYGARYMDPKISMWLGVDPLAEKYPEIGPYIYCHNNPINLIDPNGKNDYILNLDGEIKLIEENSNDFNTIFAYDGQGGIDKNTKIDVPKPFNESKTTTQVQGRTSKDADGNKISTYEFDLYTVDDEQIASNIFEFLAKNSDVEWSNTKVSSKDNTSFNLISTSHKEGSEVGMRYTFEKYKNNCNFTIDYAIHSHLPESVGYSPGDIKFAKDAKSIYPNIELKIYNRIEYKSFDQYDIPGVLNEVVVPPQKR